MTDLAERGSTAPTAHGSGQTAGMEPTRNPQVTLPDLIEVLLNKGTYLNLDLIISVADIPLIGINLRATIAGMETMLEYGMMRDWDEKTRLWVQRSVARNFPLRPGEEVIAKMAGGHFQEGFSRIWRPGNIYVTNQRLVAFRRDPKEILWQSDLSDIMDLSLQGERTIGGEERTRLIVRTSDDATTMLSAAAPQRIRELVIGSIGLPHVRKGSGPESSAHESTAAGAQPPEAPPAQREPDTLLREGHMWYLERRAQGQIWRAGHARLDTRTGFTWKGPLDARPAVNLAPAEILSVEPAEGQTPVGHSNILQVVGSRDRVYLTSADIGEWEREIAVLVNRDPGSAHTSEAENGA
ncbi:hypothetical protein GCM10022261_19940 [Brevibacterium daeguense]|uniref:Gas vesicle protein n=1 Tax=Brevibacterium daeguense TaxID=909936 RepID=A0ABP8EKH1_9MICO|nr:gas vesicle protein GvpJ [Brevibacterium daeguense]